MDSSRKRKFDGGRDWGYHIGNWDRSRGHGPRNLEGKNHRNGAIFGGGRGGPSGGKDRNNGGGGGARGGEMVTTPKPPPIWAENVGRQPELLGRR